MQIRSTSTVPPKSPRTKRSQRTSQSKDEEKGGMRFMHNKQVPGDGNWGLSTPVCLLCTTRTQPERQTSYIDSSTARVPRGHARCSGRHICRGLSVRRRGVVVACPKLLDSPTVLPPAAISSPKNLPTGASLTRLSSMRAPRLQTSGSMTSRGLYTPVGASAAARKEEGRERLETGGRGPQGSQQQQKNCSQRRKKGGTKA